MMGISDGRLTAAVSEAGGLGTLSTATFGPDGTRQEIEKITSLTDTASRLAAVFQDGSPIGTLTNFSICETDNDCLGGTCACVDDDCSCVQNPAERLGHIIHRVENAGDVAHDNIACVLPVLNSKVLLLPMLCLQLFLFFVLCCSWDPREPLLLCLAFHKKNESQTKK